MKKESDLEYCERDYKHKHYWESIGVVETIRTPISQIFRCTQCFKCKKEILHFVNY